MRYSPHITLRNFSFNDFAFSEYLVVENITRSPILEVENTLLDIPGKRGYQIVNRQFKGTKITLNCRMLLDHWLDLDLTASFLAAKLCTEAPAKLELYDSDLIEYVVLDEGVNYESVRSSISTGLMQITFLNPSGKRYGQEYAQEFSPGDTLSLINLGTIPADFTITAKSEAVRASVSRTKPDKHLRFDDLAVGEKITIDSENLGIQGLTARKGLSLDSRFFTLDPGTTEVNFEGLSGDITWRDTWI